jgi:site-specific DNA-methyltransferase (adenine-specific)
MIFWVMGGFFCCGVMHVETNVVILGDCIDVLRELPDNSIDSVVTDPPYGLSKEPDIEEVLTKWMAGEDYEHRGGGFMGKTWDSFVPGPSIWREVYRVLRPGGHALVFAGTRTQDLMTISLRLAGFEIRDVIEWLYFSGFPKSLDVGKAFDKRAGAEREVIGKGRGIGKKGGETYSKYGGFKAGEIEITASATELARKWDGWGTALKPAHEPIIMARKPLGGTVADNVERWGTGALNIDGCRVGNEELVYSPKGIRPGQGNYVGDNYKPNNPNTTVKGRFPANIVTTETDAFWSKYCNITPPELSKKASKKDRNSDWRGEEITLPERILEKEAPLRHAENRTTSARNTHPTVKPTDLMAWLVRLVTPPDGIVLDPFAGSGSTLVAAKREGFQYIGIEREAEYVEIAKARVG